MSYFKGLTLTKKGEQLQAKINGNLSETLVFTKAKLGSGEITNDNEIRFLTDLKTSWGTANVSNCEIQGSDKNTVAIELQFSNESLKEDKIFREIGLYARGNDGQEVLYAYANAAENYDYIPTMQNSPHTFVIVIYFKITTGTKVSATIDLKSYVTQEKLNLKLNDVDNKYFLANGRTGGIFDYNAIGKDVKSGVYTEKNKGKTSSQMLIHFKGSGGSNNASQFRIGHGTQYLQYRSNTDNSQLQDNWKTVWDSGNLEVSNSSTDLGDLNNLTDTSKLKIVSFSSSAATLANHYPVANAWGRLKVSPMNGGVEQEIFYYSINHLYKRTYINSTWSNWVRMDGQEKLNIDYTTENVDSFRKGIHFRYPTTTIQMPYIAHERPMVVDFNYSEGWVNQLAMDFNGNMYIRGRDQSKGILTPWTRFITESIFSVHPITTENLNTIKLAGMYVQNHNAQAQTGRNYPEQNAGCLEVLNSAYGVMQRYTTWDTFNTYLRNMQSNGSFGSWVKVSARGEFLALSGGTLTGNLTINSSKPYQEFKIDGTRHMIIGLTNSANNDAVWSASEYGTHVVLKSDRVYSNRNIYINNDKVATETWVNSNRSWNNISEKPSAFNPANHAHTWASLTEKPGIINTTDSISTTDLASARAVKLAYDRGSAAMTEANKRLPLTGGTVSGNLTVTGTILANGNITAFSDKRLKKDISKIENAIDKIEKLNGYIFQMEGKEKTGLIAQEVKEVLQQAVIETDTKEKYLALDYGSLAGLFVESIKELKREIDILKAKVGV